MENNPTKSSIMLEITAISGENLRVNKKPVKKNAFVIVGGEPERCVTQATSVDEDGGSYPCWKDKLAVELPSSARFLTVEVHCKSSSGNRPVGAVRVPVTDFVGGNLPAGYLHRLSYRLRDRHGERNGIVNLSVKVITLPEHMGPTLQMGFPARARAVSGQVVTGVPVVQAYSMYQSYQ